MNTRTQPDLDGGTFDVPDRPAIPAGLTANASACLSLARSANGHGVEAAFPWADFCVIVHRGDRICFGMIGHREHPDTKRIAMTLNSMQRYGLIERVGAYDHNKQGVWRLSYRGWQLGRELMVSTEKAA